MMLCSESTYLAYVTDALSRLRPHVEREFGISLDGIVVKSMRELNTDIRNALINDGLDQKDHKWAIRIALAMGYLQKRSSFAAVNLGIPNNLYVNTYLHARLKISKDSISDRMVHELYHFAQMQIAPDLFEQYEGNPEAFKLRGAVIEGFAHQFAFNVSNHGDRSRHSKRLKWLLEHFPFSNPHADGYKFFKEVCEKRGNEFAMDILENLPQRYVEIRNPGLYLQRVDSGH